MRYMPVLDAVRFLSALMVLLMHMGWRNPYDVVQYNPGWVGVEIFFIISGFVITGSSREVTPLAFARRRIARLYPAAICCLLVGFVFMRGFGNVYARATGLAIDDSVAALLGSLTLIGPQRLASALWTLPVELMFYALVMLSISRNAAGRLHLLAYALILWSAPYLILSFASMFGWAPFTVLPLGYGYWNMTFLRHGCFFGLGTLIFLLSERASTDRNGRTERGMIVLALSFCCLEIAGRAYELAPLYLRETSALGLACSAMAIFLFFVAVVWRGAIFNEEIRLSPRAQALLRTLGLMSYPIYLLHEAVAGTIMGFLISRGANTVFAQLYGISVVILLSLAIVLYLEPIVRAGLMRVIDPLLTGSFAKGRTALNQR